MKFDTLLFDFDETLVSSKAAYYAAYKHALVAHLGDTVEDLFEDIWKRPQALKEFFKKQGRERAALIMESFEIYYYSQHHNLKTYPYIVEVLEKLRTAGISLGIVSLKPRRAGEKELDFCGLRHFFDVVIWGDDVEAPKPAPEGCFRALENLNGKHAIMCGDSVSDIEMGKAAGILTVAALWGEVDRELLLATIPDYECEHPEQLIELVLNY
ncbi:MAG: HAD-IA family hydrolase [Blastocatellia bacterium]|nr:HAD-IA family hydrolase [Blastocatellia bacterium]